MPEREPPSPSVPQSKAVPKKRTRLSLVWVIPILAAIVGAWVAVIRIRSEGPQITIYFRSAEGLEAKKTKIYYNGVDIGTVATIELCDDQRLLRETWLKRLAEKLGFSPTPNPCPSSIATSAQPLHYVVTTAQMAPKTEGFLVADTQFWVVRPRISGANISGLGTLISGAYIGIDIGTSKESKSDFVALETPPVITGEVPGRFFILKTPDLGSLDTGTPIYFRRLQVGQVASYSLDPDGKFLTVKAFVQAPYDQFVTSDTRFWHASGIDLSLTASGLNVQTQSMLSILVGGIAFETASNVLALPAAEENTVFTLYSNRAEAFNPPPRNPQTYELIFKESVRGLEPGAPVEFRGIPVGSVKDISAQIDLKTFDYSVPVTIQLDPQRLGVKIFDLGPHLNLETIRKKLIDTLVAHGVRAQLRTGNLLTGSAYVALDFFPSAAPATVDWSQKPVQLPTTSGQFQATEANVEDIIAKVDKMPLKEIGDNLNKAITDLDSTIVTARGTLASAQGTFDNTGHLTGPNSVQIQQLGDTLREISRAARSIRVLADYLERHPEALVRGKTGEAK